MRKISEKELRKRGIKLKSEDLDRMAASKSSKVISDVSKAMQETVNVLAQISKKIFIENSKSPNVTADTVKLLGKDNGGVQKVEIVGGDDKQPKQWRVRITGRDRDGLISEMIMEQV